MSIVAIETPGVRTAAQLRGACGGALRLYFRLITISMKSQLQYRVSTALMTFGHFATCTLEFVAMWALFSRFGQVREWRLAEVCVFYGVINCAFSVAEAFTRGFDTFPGMIKSGAFDTMLLRPRSTVLQMLGAEFQLMRFGRLIQGVAVLLWGIMALGLECHAWQVALLLAATLGGVCLFSGLFVLYATLSFWTVESLELFNVLTYGGVETAQYPVTLYRPWVRWFFTLAVPLAAINYFPLHAVLGRADAMGSTVAMQCLSPLVGVLFLMFSLQVWKFGVRHYCSSGS